MAEVAVEAAGSEEVVDEAAVAAEVTEKVVEAEEVAAAVEEADEEEKAEKATGNALTQAAATPTSHGGTLATGMHFVISFFPCQRLQNA